MTVASERPSLFFMTAVAGLMAFETAIRAAIAAVLHDAARNKATWDPAATVPERALLLSGSVMVLKAGAKLNGNDIETIVFPPGAVLADGTVAGIPAKGDVAGWLKPDIDTLCAVWVPACLSDGRGSARTVGPVLKDANGHEYTLSPSPGGAFEL